MMDVFPSDDIHVILPWVPAEDIISGTSSCVSKEPFLHISFCISHTFPSEDIETEIYEFSVAKNVMTQSESIY